MAIKVVCKITVSDQAYEGGVVDGVAFEVDGWAGGAPASFATSHHDIIENLIDGAISQAQTKAKEKLSILKPKQEVDK